MFFLFPLKMGLRGFKLSCKVIRNAVFILNRYQDD